MTAAIIDRGRSALVASMVVAVATAAGLLLTSPASVRIGVALGISVLAGVVALRKSRLVLYALPIWLVGLGTLRRLTSGLEDVAPTTDALLAIGPVAFVLLGGLAISDGALNHRTPLTTATVGLIGLLALSALNPRQGGLTVGFAGAAVVVAPMLAFLVGRSLVTDRTMAVLLGLVAGLAIPAAAYGLFQTFVGFPSWDERWIDTLGYTALNVGGAIRPFGSFASGQEFGTFSAIGLIVVLANGHRLRWAWGLPAIGLLASAVWYESARGVLVSTIAAVGVVLCARAGWSMRRTAAVGLALLGALPWISSQVLPNRFGDDAGSRLASHQVEGLTDPFGGDSTLPGHIDRAVGGVGAAFRDPLGSGVGSITGAAEKFGGTAAGTEVDIGNIGVAVGLPGLLTFLIVVALSMIRSYKSAIVRRDPMAIAAVGILVVTLFQWLNGGMYSVIWLPWMILGWIDGQRADERPLRPSPSAAVLVPEAVSE